MNDKKIGRTPEVTDADIIAAGNALSSENKNITGFALRKAVGNRGDGRRLLKIWTEYQSTKSSMDVKDIKLTHDQKLAIDETAASIAETLKALIIDMHNKSQLEAQEQITTLINLADTRKKQAYEEIDDATHRINELETKLSLMDELSLEKDETISKLEDEIIENQTALKSLQDDLFKLNDELTSCNTEIEHKKYIEDSLNEKNSTLTKYVDSLNVDKDKLSKEVQLLKDSLLQKSQEHDKLIKTIVEKFGANFDEAA